MYKVKKAPFPIRFSEEEINFLREKASKNNKSISSYVRGVVLSDISLQQNHTFESKILKAISICTGFSQVFANSKFSDEEFKDFEAMTKKIMVANGIDESAE
jgi:hypothetical protein